MLAFFVLMSFLDEISGKFSVENIVQILDVLASRGK